MSPGASPSYSVRPEGAISVGIWLVIKKRSAVVAIVDDLERYAVKRMRPDYFKAYLPIACAERLEMPCPLSSKTQPDSCGTRPGMTIRLLVPDGFIGFGLSHAQALEMAGAGIINFTGAGCSGLSISLEI